jgi:hypothetical protein
MTIIMGFDQWRWTNPAISPYSPPSIASSIDNPPFLRFPMTGLLGLIYVLFLMREELL